MDIITIGTGQTNRPKITLKINNWNKLNGEDREMFQAHLNLHADNGNSEGIERVKKYIEGLTWFQ